MNERFLDVIVRQMPELWRECGVLWLVFSILDRLVINTLTAAWIVSNVSVSIAAWLLGIYIEARTVK